MPAEASIEIRLEPGHVATAVTRRLRSSRPPPPQARLSFGSLRRTGSAVVAAVIAGSALLALVCIRYAGRERASPPVEAPATVAGIVAPSASVEALAASLAADEVSVAPRPARAAPSGSAVPRGVSSAATPTAPTAPAPPAAPKAKRGPPLTRDDVL